VPHEMRPLQSLRNHPACCFKKLTPILSVKVRCDSEVNEIGNTFSIVRSLICDFRMATTRGRWRSAKLYSTPSHVINQALRRFAMAMQIVKSNRNKIGDRCRRERGWVERS
jgi:hypothetical protein